MGRVLSVLKFEVAAQLAQDLELVVGVVEEGVVVAVVVQLQ